MNYCVLLLFKSNMCGLPLSIGKWKPIKPASPDFPLYCTLREANNGHSGFLYYLDRELGTKTFIWVHMQSVALLLTEAATAS